MKTQEKSFLGPFWALFSHVRVFHFLLFLDIYHSVKCQKKNKKKKKKRADSKINKLQTYKLTEGQKDRRTSMNSLNLPVSTGAKNKHKK